MLKAYQWGELIGILLLVVSTATQMFYVDPLRREIEWRLAAFSMQQNAAMQLKATYASRIATLEALNAPAAAIKTAEMERDEALASYKTADANIADYLLAKEPVEDALETLVLILFSAGTLLAGLGRAVEMLAERRRAAA